MGISGSKIREVCKKGFFRSLDPLLTKIQGLLSAPKGNSFQRAVSADALAPPPVRVVVSLASHPALPPAWPCCEAGWRGLGAACVLGWGGRGKAGRVSPGCVGRSKPVSASWVSRGLKGTIVLSFPSWDCSRTKDVQITDSHTVCA